MSLRRENVPPAEGPGINVRRLAAAERWEFTILAEAVAGFYCHWNGHFTCPCDDQPGQCKGCRAGWPLKWKGFLHVWNERLKVEEFVELTRVSVLCLLEAYPQNEPLRGGRIAVRRMNGQKARLQVTLNHACQKPHLLPEEKDPAPVLEKLWSLVPGNLRVKRAERVERQA